MNKCGFLYQEKEVIEVEGTQLNPFLAYPYLDEQEVTENNVHQFCSLCGVYQENHLTKRHEFHPQNWETYSKEKEKGDQDAEKYRRDCVPYETFLESKDLKYNIDSVCWFKELDQFTCLKHKKEHDFETHPFLSLHWFVKPRQSRYWFARVHKALFEVVKNSIEFENQGVLPD